MSQPSGAAAPSGAHLPRSFRVDPDLWDEALEAARRRGTTRSAVLTRALAELVEADRTERAWRDGLHTDQPSTDRQEHRP